MALYLYADGSWFIEDFNDTPVTVQLDDTTREIAARNWTYQGKSD